MYTWGLERIDIQVYHVITLPLKEQKYLEEVVTVHTIHHIPLPRPDPFHAYKTCRLLQPVYRYILRGHGDEFIGRVRHSAH
jgi:hypothetical protein